MREKITVLQGGRAVAALAVLFLHAAILTERQGPARPLGWTFLDRGELGVDFFFVLSGFIILYAHMNDRREWMAAVSYAWRRATRIYVPYVPLVLAIIAIYTLVPRLGTDKNWSLFTSLTLFAVQWPPAPALSVAWTLIHELMFYTIFLLSYFTRRFRWLIAVWVVLIAVDRFLPTSVSDAELPPAVQATLKVFLAPINVEFVAGMVAAVAVRSLSPVWAHVVLALGVAGLIAFFAIPESSRLWFGVAMAFAIAGLVRLELSGSISTPVWLVFLGNASYAIYLIHGPVITVAARAFAGLALSWPVSVTLCAALGLGCGALYHVLFEKPALAYVNRWRPGRIAPQLASPTAPLAARTSGSVRQPNIN